MLYEKYLDFIVDSKFGIKYRVFPLKKIIYF